MRAFKCVSGDTEVRYCSITELARLLDKDEESLINGQVMITRSPRRRHMHINSFIRIDHIPAGLFTVIHSLGLADSPSPHKTTIIGSRPSDHYCRSVCLSVCLFFAQSFSHPSFDPIWIKLGHMLHVRV